MDEIDFEIEEDIKVSHIFKKFQNKNTFNDIIEDKIEENNDSLNKDFENNVNNIYNINNTLFNTDEDFYIEYEDDDELKKTEITIDNINIENKKKDEFLNLEEDDLNSYKNNLKKASYEELKSDLNNMYNINNFKFDDNENKDSLLESKNKFDIGNIYNSDYNDETIVFNVSVDLNKDEFQRNKIENKEHSNDSKDFYTLQVDEIPNRKNLLEKIYEKDLNPSTEQNKSNNKKTKHINILGKIFKRSEK